MIRPALVIASLALPAAADSPESWAAFQAEVAAACSALVTETGTVSVEVNPFGSESFGAAIVTVTAEWGSDRMICIFDKASRKAELTAAFPPEG
jgi:hypothetical protein